MHFDFKHFDRKAATDAGTKALAVVGLLAILSAATYGVVRIPQLAPNAFSGFTAAVANLTSRFYLGADRQETLIFTMPTNDAASGEPFTFSWNDTGRAGETYVFTYECRDGISESEVCLSFSRRMARQSVPWPRRCVRTIE